MWDGASAAVVETFLALLPIINPIGGAPFFYGLTANDTPAYRQRQARQTAMYVMAILAAFLLAGRPLLTFFGITLPELEVAGGVLVGHTAWQMITSSTRITASEHAAAADQEDIAFTPMALPLLAGPGAIGIIIGLSTDFNHPGEYAGALVGIIAMGAVTYACLALAGVLMQRLGSGGITALNRVLGFFILAIAVHLIAEGIDGLVTQIHTSPR